MSKPAQHSGTPQSQLPCIRNFVITNANPSPKPSPLVQHNTLPTQLIFPANQLLPISAAPSPVYAPTQNTQSSDKGQNQTQTEAKYGPTVLTLENVLLPAQTLASSPSVQDGLTDDEEMDLRILGCELIQTSGILLKLPQV